MAKSNAFTLIGGGHIAAATSALGYEDQMGHLSSGGGACISMLAGKKGYRSGIKGFQQKIVKINYFFALNSFNKFLLAIFGFLASMIALTTDNPSIPQSFNSCAFS